MNSKEAKEAYTLLSGLAVHRPFYISICISTLPTQHTTFKINLEDVVFINSTLEEGIKMLLSFETNYKVSWGEAELTRMHTKSQTELQKLSNLIVEMLQCFNQKLFDSQLVWKNTHSGAQYIINVNCNTE